MKKLLRPLNLGILAVLTLSLTSCAPNKVVLHPTYVKDGACEFKKEDVCYPAPGYTAFSDYYLNEVIQIKIDKSR